jgi:hypothetical protein
MSHICSAACVSDKGGVLWLSSYMPVGSLARVTNSDVFTFFQWPEIVFTQQVRVQREFVEPARQNIVAFDRIWCQCGGQRSAGQMVTIIYVYNVLDA